MPTTASVLAATGSINIAMPYASGSGVIGNSISSVIHDAVPSNLNMENKMSNTTAIKQQTLVFGTPLDHITDEQMWSIINQHKKKADALREHKVQPKSLRAQIKKIDEEVEALVALVDSRFKAE